ncbi:unnamed protein product, partial [marine sediment metagenome]
MHQETSVPHHIIWNLPSYIFWKDINLCYLGCNENFFKLSGLKNPAKLIGKTDYEMPWIKCASKYREDDKEILQGHSHNLTSVEELVVTEKVKLTIYVVKKPIYQQGRITGIQGYAKILTNTLGKT